MSPIPYTPSPNHRFEPIPEFTSQHSLSIVNAQESTNEINIGDILANRKAWTGVAIQITERELKARGIRIDPGASRSLRLAITAGRHSVGMVSSETQIDMRVETGDGYSATYTGKNGSVLVYMPYRRMDGLMMRVVVEMLKDPKIVRYLTQ